MKRSKLKKHVAVQKYMSNTKRERHTREDNSNNINIQRTHMPLKCFYCFIVAIKHVSLSDESVKKKDK